ALLALRGKRDWALAGVALGVGVSSMLAAVGAQRSERAERRARGGPPGLPPPPKGPRGPPPAGPQPEGPPRKFPATSRAGGAGAAPYRYARAGERSDELRRISREELRILAGHVDDMPAELGAVHNLFALVEVDRELPHPDRWAASPRTLLRLTALALALPEG